MQETHSRCIKWHLHACIYDSCGWALACAYTCNRCSVHIPCASTVHAQKQHSSPLAFLKKFSAAVLLLQLFTVQKSIISLLTSSLLCSLSFFHPPVITIIIIIIYFQPVHSGAGSTLCFPNLNSPVCHRMLQVPKCWIWRLCSTTEYIFFKLWYIITYCLTDNINQINKVLCAGYCSVNWYLVIWMKKSKDVYFYPYILAFPALYNHFKT